MGRDAIGPKPLATYLALPEREADNGCDGNSGVIQLKKRYRAGSTSLPLMVSLLLALSLSACGFDETQPERRDVRKQALKPYPEATITSSDWTPGQFSPDFDAGGDFKHSQLDINYKLARPTTFASVNEYYDQLLTHDGWTQETTGLLGATYCRIDKSDGNRTHRIALKSDGVVRNPDEMTKGRSSYYLSYAFNFKRTFGGQRNCNPQTKFDAGVRDDADLVAPGTLLYDTSWTPAVISGTELRTSTVQLPEPASYSRSFVTESPNVTSATVLAWYSSQLNKSGWSVPANSQCTITNVPCRSFEQTINGKTHTIDISFSNLDHPEYFSLDYSIPTK